MLEQRVIRRGCLKLLFIINKKSAEGRRKVVAFSLANGNPFQGLCVACRLRFTKFDCHDVVDDDVVVFDAALLVKMHLVNDIDKAGVLHV